jgi:hypothetical protein
VLSGVAIIWLVIGLSLLSMSLPRLWLWFKLFILVPIKVHRTSTITARPPGEAKDPGSLTPEMRDFFGFVIDRLREAGFEELVLIAHSGAVPGVNSAQSLLVNRATGDLAVAIATHAGLSRSLVYAIRTDFADGSRISTGVNPGIGVSRKNPRDVVNTFAFVEDPVQLYEAHRRLMSRQGLTDRPRGWAPTTPDEALAYNEWDWQHSMAWPVDCGYRWLDEQAGLYRFTWKGAFFSSWRITQPVKRWRIARRDRAARRLWQELGMPLTPAAAEQPEPRLVQAVESDEQLSRVIPSALRYETSLTFGEVRVEREDHQVTVRAGGMKPLQALAWQKIRFLGIAIYGSALTLHLYWWWRWHQVQRALPPSVALRRRGGPGPAFFPAMMAIWGILVLWEVYKIALALRRARGTAVVVASPAGLRFRNGFGRMGEGEFARAQVHLLTVVPVAHAWRNRIYALVIGLREGGRHDVLLIGKDQTAVTEARSALTEAMGIERAAEPSTAEAGAAI